jgi:hypothetical protein
MKLKFLPYSSLSIPFSLDIKIAQKILSLFTISIITITSSAQVTFTDPNELLGVYTGAVKSVDVGDYDMNGDYDLIYTNYDELVLLSNYCNNTSFAKIERLLDINTDIVKAVFVDIDNDGDQDIFMVSVNDRELILLEYDSGTNEWKEPRIQNYPEGEVSDFVFTDSDLDGDLDLILAHIDLGKLEFLENQGNLTFGSPLKIADVDEVSRVETYDINQDGKEDLICKAKVRADILYCLNIFSNQTVRYTRGSISNHNTLTTTQITPCDLNGDGETDFLHSDNGSVWLIDGPSRTYTKIISTFHDKLVAKDIDQDGVQEIFAFRRDYPILFYKKSDQTGEYVLMDESSFTLDNDYLLNENNIIFKDFDQDGRLDIICYSEKFNIIYASINDSNTGFKNGYTNLKRNPGVGNQIQTAFSDFNQNQVQDFLYSAESLFLYEFDSTCNALIEKAILEEVCDQFVLADFDGDGFEDIVCYEINEVVEEPFITFVKYDAPKDSIERIILPFEYTLSRSRIIDIKADDFDKDGLVDLFVTRKFNLDERLFLLKNEGNFEFSEPELLLGDGGLAYDLGDVNGDGWTDIAYRFNSKNYIKRNKRDGTFLGSIPWDNLTQKFSKIKLLDIDNDGDDDVVISIPGPFSYLPGSAKIYMNTGKGKYVGVVNLADESQAPTAKAVDFNNDGLMDISLLSDDGDFYILIQTNPLVPKYSLKIIDNIEDLDTYTIYDYNNDGFQDIIGTKNRSSVLLYLNEGTNRFRKIVSAFHDLNQNAQKDPGEPVLQDQQFNCLPPSYLKHYQKEQTVFYIEDTLSRAVFIQPDTGWQVLGDSRIAIDKLNADTILFPMIQIPISNQQTIDVALGLGSSGSNMPIWITVKNDGHNSIVPHVFIELDSLLSTDSSQFDIRPNVHSKLTYEWKLDTLAPNRQQIIKGFITAPDSAFVNYPFQIKALLSNTGDFISDITDADTLTSGVSWSYNPLKKSGYPKGIDVPGYIPHGQDLTYTINFQNTNSDTASFVYISDNLDSDFDNQSIKIITSSHPVEYTFQENSSSYYFVFRDIKLPSVIKDSLNNQGFVKFRVKPLENLPDKTRVNNIAFVSLNYGSAYETNFIRNTYSDFIPQDSDGDFISDSLDCDSLNFFVFPGAQEIVYNGLDDDCNPNTLDDDLDRDGYPLAEDCNDKNRNIHPGAIDIPNNGIDEDCDGMDMIVSSHEIGQSTIKIYPNPVSNNLIIETEDHFDFKIRIFNLQGQSILEDKNNTVVDVSSIPNGFYLLEIIDLKSGKKLVESIVVER